MEELRGLLKSTAKQYNKLQPHHVQSKRLSIYAHAKLTGQSSYEGYGSFAGRPRVLYNVFAANAAVSRPIRPDIFIPDPGSFVTAYETLEASLRAGAGDWTPEITELANQVVYTAVMSVACCFDLWQRGSRKTPGTFFEILMASLLQQMLPEATFSKHIPLAALLRDPDVAGEPTDALADDSDADDDDGASVSTDLVLSLPAVPGGVVIPLKITTRERIVQPFAHQRILDAAFGADQYQSLLVCISETQLDDKTRSVKQVCVPGTVKLFQKYLAPIGGLYYCDVPQRYAAPDMQRIIPVRSVGEFFPDISRILADHKASRP